MWKMVQVLAMQEFAKARFSVDGGNGKRKVSFVLQQLHTDLPGWLLTPGLKPGHTAQPFCTRNAGRKPGGKQEGGMTRGQGEGL